MSQLSHYDAQGRARMVDVTAKQSTRRSATACAFVRLSEAVLRELPKNPKGDPLEVARFAGIAAAKQTSALIPMCHPLPIGHIDVRARVCENDSRGTGVELLATVSTTAPTGVEMEAMTAVSVAALTVYDMCKALDKSIEIGPIVLLEKTGGKSGAFRRQEPATAVRKQKKTRS
jgi:cyclic pyranopterin monophosphate synthase